MSVDETAKLKKLYNDNDAAKVILDYFASQDQSPATTTVDRVLMEVASAGCVINRRDLVHFFKEMEKLKYGVFKAGRRKQPSRFEWTAQVRSVGLVSIGRANRVAALTESETDRRLSPPLQPVRAANHVFLLRPDFTVSIQLPSDLTHNEAERLSAFVRTLPFQ